MTEEEARRLKVGDVVEAKLSGQWVKVRVAQEMWESSMPRGKWDRFKIRVRRIGLTPDDRPHGAHSKRIDDVRPFADLDHLPANVYADWLEDHGERRAAEKLREAFPLASEGGKP